jgi:hypothetical protein
MAQSVEQFNALLLAQVLGNDPAVDIPGPAVSLTLLSMTSPWTPLE